MKTDEIASVLVDYLVKEGQTGRLPQLSQAFAKIVQQVDKEKEVIITTAIEINGEKEEKVRSLLEDIFGRKVGKITKVIDKDILGGIKIQVGDMVVDASIKGELDRLKNELLA